MSKNKNDKSPVDLSDLSEGYEAPEPVASVFTNVALGIHRVPHNTGYRYILVEVPYNPETGDTGFIKEIAKDIKEDILDQFKLAVVEKIFDKYNV